MESEIGGDLLLQIENLKSRLADTQQRFVESEQRLAESEQLIEAIKAGEVDAFAFKSDDVPEIYTLKSGDYAYRLLIEELGEGAVNLSEDGLIVYTNTCFADLIQLKYENVIGRYISDFIQPESQKTFNDLFEKAMSGKSKGEINLQSQGKLIPVMVSFASLRPNLTTIGMIISDQTEKRKHEEIVNLYQKDLVDKNAQLAQSNLELHSFSYVASHDLQEPLRKIQTFCQRIEETSIDEFSDTTRDYFKRIVNASQRMQHLISSLLEYSRMNSIHTASEVDLNEIIQDVIEMQLDEKKADVQIIMGQLPVVLAIPDQMKQLFNNLISNAIKYRRPEVPLVIEIGSAVEGNFLKITVSDNGIGFEPQYADKIFELFQRLHSQFEYAGTGIGLSICKKIVQNHNGLIKAIGKPGEGASFEIFIPRSTSS